MLAGLGPGPAKISTVAALAGPFPTLGKNKKRCPLWGVGSARTAGRSLFWSVIVLKPYCEPERHSKMHVRSAWASTKMRFSRISMRIRVAK